VNRRELLRGFGLFVAAPVIAAGHDATPAVTRSDRGVPLYLDCRKNSDCAATPIIIERYGATVDHVVAYDLQDDTVTVHRVDPNGNCLHVDEQWEYETMRGGVRVVWDYDRLAQERRWREERIHV
jgi:hypothetical protein